MVWRICIRQRGPQVKRLGILLALVATIGIFDVAHADRNWQGRGPERSAGDGRMQRDDRRAREDVDQRDYRRRERMSDQERRQLREDIGAAGREIYPRRR